MFRLWAREFKDGHMVRDTVVEDDTDETRTHKVFAAIEQICAGFDLSRPIWLDVNVADFKRTAVTRFGRDSFIDDIDFDYLEIRVIEED
ncbi:MAG: hypothetical protein IJ058_12490 [Lachnospiraceae bacterium]|nr:hypothetical protein [Lachnospiraceae bacterium]